MSIERTTVLPGGAGLLRRRRTATPGGTGLDFRVNDLHQNPLAMALPSAPPLLPNQLEQFRANTGAQLARLDQIRGFNLAQAD